mgnify:CR=1 FL=1
MFLTLHYENESGEIVTWKIAMNHLVDICITEDGEVYVTTTATDGQGILVIETEKDIENILESAAPMYCSCDLECTENNG